MKTAPYGSWESPISIEHLTAGSVGLTPVALDGGNAYWLESRASEAGRVSLWRQLVDGTRTELTPEHNVRTMVHEYGGGACDVVDGIVVFSSLPSHRAYSIINGHTAPLTPDDDKYRYADFRVFPGRNLVLAIREDHHDSDIDCVNTLVALNLHSDNPDGGKVLCQGADFYACPSLSADGQLAWMEWDHPNMPWDSTRLMLGQLNDADLDVEDVRQVAGTATSAPCYPGWVDDELVFLDDPSGFWNFYALRGDDVVRLHEADHDFCTPHWVFGHMWTALPDGTIVAAPVIDGAEVLGGLRDGVFTPWECSSVATMLSPTDESRVLLVSSPKDAPASLELFDPATQNSTTLREAMAHDLNPAYFSVAQAVDWEGPYGTVHAWYYPPTNPDFAAPDGELPPLRVLSHGGPTGMSLPMLNMKRQYWTSRGWAIIDVDYSGSCGYGRAYRERLQGTWGVADVRDCVDAAKTMVERGLADPKRLSIEGGSAGGYTTLAALTSDDTFTAGNCLYGIGDLAIMAEETHKFESRYLFGLIGGTPDEIPEVYTERSPLFHLDRLSCPMLIQQGEEDRVVPPNQATLMADAVRAKGLPVALMMFPGEGHGFRQAETIKASTEGAASFFGQVFGFTPAGVDKIEIENL